MDYWNEDVEFAKVAESAERYEDMAKVSSQLADPPEGSFFNERGGLSL